MTEAMAVEDATTTETDEAGSPAAQADPVATPEGPVDAATGEPAPADVKIRKTTYRLRVEMTAAERDEVNEELLEQLDELERLEAKKKALAAEAKAEIEATKVRAAELRQKLRARGRTEDVWCEERTSFATCTVTVVRCDTAEVISTRAMTATERQAELFGDYAPPAGKASNEEARQADLAADGHPPADDPGWDSGADDDDTEDATGSQVVTNGDTPAPGLVVHDGGKAQSSRKRSRRSSDRAAE